MLKLFVTKQDFTNLFLLVYIILFYIVGYGQEVSLSDFGIVNGVLGSFISDYPVLSRFLAGTLLFLHALFINVILKKVHYYKKENLFGGMFYIFLNALSGSFLTLTPLLLINTFLLFALYEATNLYNVRDNISAITNIGLMIGFSMLVNPAVVFFLLFGYLTLNIYRPFKLNEKLALIISILLPLFLAWAYFFYYNIPSPFRSFFSQNFSFFSFNITLNYLLGAIFGGILLLTLLALISPVGMAFRKIIEAEKFRQVLFWFLVSGVFYLTFSKEIKLEDFRILFIPIAVMLGIKISSLSRLWGEVLHVLSVLLILFLLVAPKYLILA